MNTAIPADTFHKDCLQTIELFDNWPSAWQPLVDAFNDKKPLVIVGEGSSCLFPGQYAQFLARRWGYSGHISSMGGREASNTSWNAFTPLWMSNSGSTREVVECARAKADGLAIIGVQNKECPLAVASSASRHILIRDEQAIAATASVFGQAFIIAEALATSLGKSVPYAELQAGLKTVLNTDIPATITDALAKCSRLWWADGGDGVGSELALKTMEITGKIGIHAPGTILLHGIEEVLTAEDALVWHTPPSADLGLLNSALRENTEAVVISEEFSLPQLGEWTPLIELAFGWRLLASVAEKLGRNPATAERARKVGNPLI